MFLKKDTGRTTFKEDGDKESRIGPVRRNAKGKSLDRVEELLHSQMPHGIDMDATCSSGPYFERYSYSDVLGGFRLRASSMEINARVVKDILKSDTPCPDLDVSAVYDKYALSKTDISSLSDKTVILLPGNNAISAIKIDMVDELVHQGAYIKPHPISSPEFLQGLGERYGFDKVLDSTISGLSVYRQANQVVTSATSEFLLLAALESKPQIDITRRTEKWKCVNGDIATFLDHDDLESTRTAVNRALMHPNSGYLHPSMSDEEIVQRINDFCSLAETLREPFKSVIDQELTTIDRSAGPLESHAFILPNMGKYINRSK